ncbi:hypothetical protein G9A89_000257 [Geosiphon pyriformis]|nr:hypothetical protein G9A89_000257 [Geosiphon pyriformis]
MSKAIVVGITGWWGGSYWDRNLTMPPNYAKAWTTIHLGGVYPRSYLAIPVPPYPLWIDRGSGWYDRMPVLKSNGPCTYELWEFGESTAWSIQYLTHPLVTYWEECTVESLYGYGVTIMVSTPLDSVHEGPLERLFGFPKGSDFSTMLRVLPSAAETDKLRLPIIMDYQFMEGIVWIGLGGYATSMRLSIHVVPMPLEVSHIPLYPIPIPTIALYPYTPPDMPYVASNTHMQQDVALDVPLYHYVAHICQDVAHTHDMPNVATLTTMWHLPPIPISRQIPPNMRYPTIPPPTPNCSPYAHIPL